MTTSLNDVRRRFSLAVLFLEKAAKSNVIALGNEQNSQMITASWIYIQTKTLLSNASATYLPKPSEEPDVQIEGELSPDPPSGWVPPKVIKLKEEEILASNHILQPEVSQRKLEEALYSLFYHYTSSQRNAKYYSSYPKLTRNRMIHRKQTGTRPHLGFAPYSWSELSATARRAPQTRTVASKTSRNKPSQTQSQTISDDTTTTAEKARVVRSRNTVAAPTPQKKSTPTTPPSNRRRSTRLAGVQSPEKDSEVPSKRSLSPTDSGSNKRPKISTPQGDKYGALHDPEIVGLPWTALTSTMQERAVGYLNRNRIHRQPQQCVRCIQQRFAREKIGEDCITMFDSLGDSIACFRCGYRQLTCSFANGALVPETPLEIEPSEPSQSETVQTTNESDSPHTEQGDQSAPEPPEQSQGITETEVLNQPNEPVNTTAASPKSPDPHPDESPVVGQGTQSIGSDIELIEAQIRVIDPSPESDPDQSDPVDNEIHSSEPGGTLASVLRENPTLPRNHVSRTYSRNDRTTLPLQNDLAAAESDHLYMLRPAFSSDPPDLRSIDDDMSLSDQQPASRSLRSCSFRELPQRAADDEIHDSVHHFRAVLHTHHSIIQMRHHLFSLLHANDSALRHSRQSLLNATAQLKQHPFPWDIPEEPPFDGLKELGDDLVCAWNNGYKTETAYKSIQKYDRTHLEVDRYALDSVEEKLDSYYYPNIAAAWSLKDGDQIE